MLLGKRAEVTLTQYVFFFFFLNSEQQNSREIYIIKEIFLNLEWNVKMPIDDSYLFNSIYKSIKLSLHTNFEKIYTWITMMQIHIKRNKMKKIFADGYKK